MLVTKTPLRVSFFGGGSDIPQFYRQHGGMVLSAAIDSFVYLAVNKCVAPHVKAIYSELELTNSADEIKHNRIRECLRYFKIDKHIEICSFSDVTTKGTGLGSSSTFTVGLLNALSNLKKGLYKADAKVLAELASYIEIEKCNEPIGKQDQYAAAFGGVNQITFDQSGEIEVREILGEHPYYLSTNLILVNTDITRDASSVLAAQVANLEKPDIIKYQNTLVGHAKIGIMLLKAGRLNDFGALLHESWGVKKKLSENISNPHIDEIYEEGLKAGALGGKLLGAGGGGYLMFYVPEKNKNKFFAKMAHNMLFVHFYHQGSQVTTI